MNPIPNPITTFLKQRRSVIIKSLNPAPMPQEDVDEIIACGLRVPDHGVLAPWKIVVITPETGTYLGRHILKPEFARTNMHATADMLAFEEARFTRAALVLAVLSCPVQETKIPQWEMELSAGALCQNLLTAALALGYGAQWVTEWYAYNDKLLETLGGDGNTDRCAGFIYVGDKIAEPKERRRPEKNDVVSIFKPART